MLLRPASVKAPLRWVGHLGRGLVDVVYPPACIVCAAATADQDGLCPRCWAGFPFIARPFCERTAEPFAYDIGGPLLSPAAIADPPVYGKARVVARYDGAAAELVKRLKFADQIDLARPMAALMARAGREVIQSCDMIVPVPLHRWRFFTRRTNQAAELALALGRLVGKPVELEALLRKKATKPQTSLSKTERRDNLAGAFLVPAGAKGAVLGKRILVVDDVITTGATANAAARILLRAGAASVDIIAFAKVVEPV